MKLAVLADIHANYIALQAVAEHLEAWQPDQVIVAGDIVNRGPRPLECLHFVQQQAQTNGWLLVRGNHEDYVIELAQNEANHTQVERDFYQPIAWTYQQLNRVVAPLTALPLQQSIADPNGLEVRVTHGTMLGNRDGIFPKTTADELRRKISPAPHVLCVGHTHWPLTRQIDKTLVVNVGSVGMPFDRDTRASYAQLTWQQGQWHAEIIRLPYNLAQTERDYFDSGYLDEGGPIVQLILDELRQARPNLYGWTKQYTDQIFTGDISVAESVSSYMSTLGLSS